MKDRQLAKRIQHQFAKYDSAGRLTCILCNCLTVRFHTSFLLSILIDGDLGG